MKKIFTSVDIGSDTVKILVSEVYNGNVNVIASNTIKSKGIRKGLIVDSNLVINTIKDGMKIINDDVGFEIKKVIVNVPDYNAKFMYVTGSAPVEEIVTTENINKVIKTSVYNKIDEEYELVTVIPINFIVDDNEIHIIDYFKVKPQETDVYQNCSYDLVAIMFDFTLLPEYFEKMNSNQQKEFLNNAKSIYDKVQQGSRNVGFSTDVEIYKTYITE